MSNILKGLNTEAIGSQNFDRQIKNITRMNPKGSAAEQIVLNRFMSTPMGNDLYGQDWIDQCAVWLETNKQKLQKEFPELDLSDVEDLAAKMYEDLLAHSGQLEEGEVVSMQARKTPLVVAGSPFDWNIYDLRTNKMVANILGGDRRESKLYEIRINRNGMTPSTKMLPTYVLTAGPDDNPPYKAYELVDTPERYGKIEKSLGPGGTTKLRPDQDDVLRHFFKVMGGGKYYGYDLALVEEGLDQYQIIEKALGAKIMEVDDAMELGYTDWDPEDSSGIVYLGNQQNEGYSAGASGGAGLGEEVDEGSNPPKVLFNPKPKQKGPDEYEYTEYIPRGKEDKEPWAIQRTIDKQKLPKRKPKELNTGFYKNYLSNRPVREDEIDENLLKTYGDQWDLDEGKAEVRAELDQAIKDFLAKGGQIEKLKPNKVRAKPGMGLASKHIGTSGEVARKVRSRFLLGKGRNLGGVKPEVKIEGIGSEAKMVNANDPRSDGWRWVKTKPSGILEGIITEYDTKIIDSVAHSLPKGLNINNFFGAAFKEFLYQKYSAQMKDAWDKLWPFFSKEYNEKYGIKEYKEVPQKQYQLLSGDIDFFDNMLLVIPKGLKSNELYRQGFKEFIYNKFGNKEWTDFKKNRYAYWDAYEKLNGSKPQGMFNKLKSKIGLDEDATADKFYQEFVNSEYNSNNTSYLDTLKGLKQFLLSKNLPADVLKFVLRKLIQKVKPELEEEKLDELKCWSGYTRVKGVPAGAPGSCKKKTKESNIMKGIQSEDDTSK